MISNLSREFAMPPQKQFRWGLVFGLSLLSFLATYVFVGRFALVVNVVALLPFGLLFFRYPIIGLLIMGFTMTSGLHYLVPHLYIAGLYGTALVMVVHKIFARDYSWRLPRISIWVLLLFAWMTAGMLLLPAHPKGLIYFKCMLEGALFFLLICELIRTPQQLRFFLFAIAAGFIFTAGSTIYGIYDFATGGLDTNNPQSTIKTLKSLRFFGHWGGPNELANSLMPLTALMLPFLRKHESRFVRYFILFAFFCAVLAVVISLSRTGIISLFIAVIFGLAVSEYRRKILIIGLISITAVMLILPSDFTKRFSSIGKKGSDSSLSERSKLYSGTFDQSVDHFPFGGGLGAFSTYYQDYITPIVFVSHTHQTYLFFLNDHGLPGLILYLWILFLLFQGVLQKQKDELRHSFERVFRICLLGTLMGICFAGFFEPVVFNVQDWMLFAFISIYPCVFAPDKKESSEQELNPTPNLQLSS